MKVFIAVAALLAVGMAAPAPAEQGSSPSGGAFNMMAKYFGSCLDSDEMGTCFAVKGITALNRAARAANIELAPGVTFARDPAVPAERTGKAISENEIISTLPADADQKSDALFDLAIDSAKRLFSARSITFKLPEETTENIARSLEEGRLLKKGKKLKKVLGPLVLALGGKLFALLPLFLGAVALLAVKALLVSKVAFVMAAVLAAQKFLGGGAGGSPLNLLSKVAGGGSGGAVVGGGASAGAGGWSSGASAGGWSNTGAASAQYPYARSYDTAQELAYSAQAPSQ
ncbi:AGAP003465-PA-like protein [Anopheles sinensis]|uniref:AGAP003465-PA-like protein n=1 Tax=Anopheles sinensis TaxID=74873 RepID=A0A084WNR3_ANOSI|nr:AGAP003465-PA-like protein [Anopheles sinensis]